MAIDSRTPPAGAVIHSDRGTQFESWAFTDRAKASGLLPSMGSIADCFDCEHRPVAVARGLTLVSIGPAGAFALTCRLRGAATFCPLAGWAVTS